MGPSPAGYPLFAEMAEPAGIPKSTIGNNNRANGAPTHIFQCFECLCFGLNHQPAVCSRAIAFFHHDAVERKRSAIARPKGNTPLPCIRIAPSAIRAKIFVRERRIPPTLSSNHENMCSGMDLSRQLASILAARILAPFPKLGIVERIPRLGGNWVTDVGIISRRWRFR